MTRITLAVIAVAAMLCFGSAPSRAQSYGDAPWCAVMELGSGEVVHDCEYYSVQDCTPNVIAGNRGFCQMNPTYRPHPERRDWR